MIISRLLTVLFALLALAFAAFSFPAGGTVEGFELRLIAFGCLAMSYAAYQLRYILR